MQIVSQIRENRTLTDTTFRFSGIPREVSDMEIFPVVSVGDDEAVVVLQARTVDSEDIFEFQGLLNNGVSSLITLRSQSGQFFLWAHGDRSLYLGAVDSFPASIFSQRIINEMQHIPNAVQVDAVTISKKLMPQIMESHQWTRLMSLADDVEFMDEATYDEVMSGLWENMGLTVYEVNLRVHIRYGEAS
jgi:hypothetical protein